MNNNHELAIYIHWPFCISKCPYCDFCSVPATPTLQKAGYISNDDGYMVFGNALLNDLKNSIQNIPVSSIGSIYFGGGTPSLMPVKSVNNIIDFLHKHYLFSNNIEITLEANPATFDTTKMREFHSVGINRISLGIQSFSNTGLHFLGRIYNSREAIAASEIIAKIFDNFSIDIMYGYESQTIESLEQDLQTAINCGCQHISCYQLTFENNTLFYHNLLAGKIHPIGEEAEIRFYNFIKYFLKKHGMYRYEISNYAKAGYESKHNTAYWKYKDYLGIGPGAHSRLSFNGKKHEIIRTNDIFQWLHPEENVISFKALNYEEILQEIIIVGLRTTQGLNIDTIYTIVPDDIVAKIITPKKLQLLQQQNLIKKYNKKIQLTNSGILKLNAIIEFLFN